MKVIMVFFILITLFSCKKEKCYECTQRIKHSYNKDIEGYPKEFIENCKRFPHLSKSQVFRLIKLKEKLSRENAIELSF
jgi:hypothetical protein